MSGKGGAGKVYFILYLAVLLEMLLIIVERDDAEDELRKEKAALEQKSKRIQLIAETIINSLRGTATSVSSTSDQSMILGDPKEAEGRSFSVRVRVADPYRDSVKELDLHLLRDGKEIQVMNIAGDQTQFPRTQEGQDYIFKYIFKPTTYGAGEYKLHFEARTNQIVGVTPDAGINDTVKIGAIHLTVGELKEVKDGIVENVGLKGYIDSLLQGQYANFATNIGANEFTVNVQPPKNPVFDQLGIFPEQVDFAAFPGLELPNPIKIQGAETGKVELVKTDGPGEFRRIDTNWVWFYKPDVKDIGQAYTVHFKGQAKRGGGAKDIAEGSFSVKVDRLEPASKSYFAPEDPATHRGRAFTGIVFKANGKKANLDGSYRMELILAGAKVAQSNEPTVEYTPVFKQDEGKKLEVKTFYKSTFMKEYVELPDTILTVQPPPLKVGPSDDLNVGDALDIKVALGIPGFYMEVGADHVDIESGGYFDATAKKIIDNKPGNNFNFEAKMTSKANNIRAKAGQNVQITVSDPITHLSQSFSLTITPKQKGSRPGGGNAPSGGIH